MPEHVRPTAPARLFAERSRKDAGPEPPTQIHLAYRLAAGRAPLVKDSFLYVE